MGLQDLRSRLSIIPQEPTLFQGTLKTNIDPFHQHSDAEIWEALDKCQLREIIRKDLRLLDAPALEEGENWSVEQRQLVCLARVLLKKRRILVLDEDSKRARLEVAEKVEEGLHLHFLPHSKIYATIDIGTARVARTRQIEFHPKSPIWNEQFRLYCAHSASAVTISIKDQLPVSARVIGRSKIPISQILTTQPIESWFDLYNDEGEKLEKAQIHVRLQFVHAKSDPNWDNGLKNSSFSGLPNSFFPQRTNCRVTLYQNSHLSNDFRPKIHLSGNKLYRAHRYWEDLYNSIIEAKHFIYVVGWSVNVSITLIRDPERMIPGAENVTIGELLKRKADEGLTVLVMIWQDVLSAMDTHDESTFNFFEQSKVKCFLCPRNPDSSLTLVQDMEVLFEFTHHQKTITLDAPIAGDEFAGRKIVSFVGGIDLCDGRYDNEKHPLFRTLDTIYLHDFQQENIPDADLHHGGPREAWHDCHSRLEGLAAWDVLTNFEQRWMKQSPDELSGCLLKIRQNPQVFPTPREEISDFEEPTWNVQVFRSIDDASVVGFPEDPAEAASLGLMSGKDVTIDQSIHYAYIEAIRRANRFIYIENQYFCGSCSSWSEDQDCGCLNLIPMEIALKIASKIRQGERFAVYVITPMWPGGVPEGETVQAILHWNRLTMEMMFGIIATAIEEMGLKDEVSPGDYLNFFCLGNREVQNPGEYVPPERPEEGTNYWKSQVNRRFSIYVHAKIMIVDDEYVIVGSANLNQRSLDGGRDSEIVQGSYQPEHINRPEGAARGHVHGYRMSLWYEHFASHYPELMHVFMEAESVECVRTVKKIAMRLWEEYIGEEVVDLPGHLLPFPIQVLQDGSITDLPENGCFPDTTASVKGETSLLRPAIITS